MNIALPKTAIAVLAGQSEAANIATDLHSAFWLYGREDSTSLYLLTKEHENLAALAAAMGYSIAPLVVADGVAE